jgi:nicotinate-nucleotide adenylyltransferase
MNRADDTGASDNAEQARQREAGVAFFGGSFDPPHLGHLAIARAARDAFHLDKVLFAPVGAQPLKPEGSAAGFEDRLAMTRLAIEGEPGFQVSLADAPQSVGQNAARPNYTLETLQNLRADFKPETEFYCLMGADAFLGLRQWHRAAEVPFAASLIVASRPGQPHDAHLLDALQAALPQGLTLEPSPDCDRNRSGPQNSSVDVCTFSISNPSGAKAPFYLLPGLDVEISATEIREAVREAAGAGSSAGGPDSAAVKAMLPAAVAGYIRSHGLYR